MQNQKSRNEQFLLKEVLTVCSGFALLHLAIGLKKLRRFPFSTNQKQNQNQSWQAHVRFPALRVEYTQKPTFNKSGKLGRD